MSDEQLDAVIDKIAKLLRLATGKGTTTHEAAAAAAKAQLLMERHRISQATIDAVADGSALKASAICELPIDRVGKPVPWKLTLGAELAGLHCCRLVATPLPTRAGAAALVVLGVHGDVEVVQHLYVYLAREIDRLAKASVHDTRLSRFFWNRNDAIQWGTSFRLGAVAEIVIRMRQVKDRARADACAAGHQRALVLLDDHERRVLEFVNKLVGGGVYGQLDEGFRQDFEAHMAGRRAAHDIALNPAMHRGDESALLPEGSEPKSPPES